MCLCHVAQALLGEVFRLEDGTDTQSEGQKGLMAAASESESRMQSPLRPRHRIDRMSSPSLRVRLLRATLQC